MNILFLFIYIVHTFLDTTSNERKGVKVAELMTHYIRGSFTAKRISHQNEKTLEKCINLSFTIGGAFNGNWISFAWDFHHIAFFAIHLSLSHSLHTHFAVNSHQPLISIIIVFIIWQTIEKLFIKWIFLHFKCSRFVEWKLI